MLTGSGSGRARSKETDRFAFCGPDCTERYAGGTRSICMHLTHLTTQCYLLLTFETLPLETVGSWPQLFEVKNVIGIDTTRVRARAEPAPLGN